MAKMTGYEEDAKQVRAASGSRTAKMKEDEQMQKDTEAVNKAGAGAGTEKGTGAQPKKKNIIQVFRPQNSRTGMVKPGARPRPKGQEAGKARSKAHPAGQQAARPQSGKAPAGAARPQASPAGAARPQASPAGTAARPQASPAGTAARPQAAPAGATARPQASPAGAAAKPQASPAGAAARPQAAPAGAAAKPQASPAGAEVKAAAGQTASTQGQAFGGKSQAAAQAPAGKASASAQGQTPAAKGQASSQGQTPAAKGQASSFQGQAPAAKGQASSQGQTPAAKGQASSQGQAPVGKEQAPAQAARPQEGKPSEAKTESRIGSARSAEGKGQAEKGISAERTRAGSQGEGRGAGRSEGQQGRRQDGGRRGDSPARSADGSGRGQGRQDSRSGRSDGTGRGQGENRSFGRGDSRTGGRSDGQGRSQGGRGDGTGRRFDGQGGQGRGQGENRSFGRSDGRSGGRFDGQGSQGRGARGGASGIPKPPAESKPLEKESRKRTERGDRNRVEKGEKLDRLEKNQGRTGTQKGGRRNQPQTKASAPRPAEKPAETIRNIIIPEKLTVTELAEAMKVQPAALVKKLFLAGTMVTVNQEIDFDTAEEIALEFNCICEKEVKVNVIEELLKDTEDAAETLIPRPPVVCVMGHVDHGKTSLLDAIRNTHVIDKEAGGITQHIGAYVVSINGQRITFLDTPGHEAFTAMRMRGANSTDIAILVVAADDGVMPQTVEAINHAKAAGIDIIVAINKIDKPSANVDRVKQELTEYGLIAEDWGGSTVCVPVSAHTHEGIDSLLEMILLTAEVAELKANPDRRARGLVIEAQLDKGKGPVATVLVQKGTLHVGDPVAAGSCHGKVRAMMDDKGRRVKEAGPSTPVEILGLSDVPNAGEIFMAMENEKEARSFAETFISEGREKLLEETKSRMTLDDLFSQIQAGSLKELNLIVKADVQGSVEAVKQSLLKLSNDEVVVKIIHGGVGAINESDVILASASNAIIIGFNVRPDVQAKASAEREGVDVRLYRVIYDAIADVEAAMKGMLDPIFEEKVIGHAEVRQLFRASGVGTIAGSYVTDGVFTRGCQARIFRDGKKIYEGSLASLKRFKDDVKEVRAGYECGFVFEKFNDLQEEDKVEAFTMVEVPR